MLVGAEGVHPGPLAGGVLRRRVDAASAGLLHLVQGLAAAALAADLAVVAVAVVYRYLHRDSLEWADEVARMLLICVAFLGGAAAVAHGRHVGILILRQSLPLRWARVLEAAGGWIELGVSLALAACAASYAETAASQVTPFGLPQNLFIWPMIAGGLCMAFFTAVHLSRYAWREIGEALVALCAVGVVFALWFRLAPDHAPGALTLMLVGFAICLASGIPIAFALSTSALVFLAVDGNIDFGVFAQQASSGIDNFVLSRFRSSC